jgi:hypothetical protein
MDVICLFISDGLDLSGAKKIHRFEGKVLDAAAEIKKRQLSFRTSRFSLLRIIA